MYLLFLQYLFYCGNLFGGFNAAGVGRHEVFGGTLEEGIAAAFDGSAHVAVSDDAHDAVGFDDDAEAKAPFAHRDDGLAHGRFGADDG